MEKRASTWAVTGVLALGLLALLALYGGAYYLLVGTSSSLHAVQQADRHVISWRPKYQIADGVGQRLFYPAHEVDRLVRPYAWSVECRVDGRYDELLLEVRRRAR